MLSLRALGNAGYPSRFVNKCLNSESNPIDVRVAAAQAFRRMPCDTDVSYLMKIVIITKLLFKCQSFCKKIHTLTL